MSDVRRKQNNLHDNELSGRPNISRGEIFVHHPYSSKIAASDCHLFLNLPKCLAGRRLRSDPKKKDAQDRLTVLTATFSAMAYHSCSHDTTRAFCGEVV